MKIFVGIGPPYERSDGAWAVSVTIEPLHKELSNAVGMDSWQAITLGMKLVKSILRTFVRDGGSLFLEGDTQPIEEGEVDEFF
jgi:hypothetical protein